MTLLSMMPERLRSLIRPNPAVRSNAIAAVQSSDYLFHQWLAFAGVLLFALFLLWQRNVLAMLQEADPTGITLIITAVFLGSTVWCGYRIARLCAERATMERWITAHQANSVATGEGCITRYFLDFLDSGVATRADRAQLTDVLAERLHGPSETAWWVNGIQIKLGLLGKVIGFSILALQLGQMDNFDPSQSQTLLKNLTGGLGIALLTTAVGLVANILLGLQLTRLDRCADLLLADALQYAETRLTMPAEQN